MHDDDLIRFMRDLDPAATPADAPLDARAEGALHRITAPAPERRRSARRWVLGSAVAALAVVAAVVTQTVLPVGQHLQAAAMTPPMLEITPTDATLADVVAAAHAALATSDSPAAPERHASSLGWYLHASFGEHGLESAVIAPEDTELRWNADLSGHLLVTAGRPYLVDEATRHELPTEENTPAEGTVLRDEDYPAGQFGVSFPQEPPADAAGLNGMLLANAVPDADVSDYFASVEGMLHEWTLTAAQHGAILDTLASYAGVELAGEAVDRAGRPGWVLRIHGGHQPTFDTLVIVDRRTGRIASAERIYLGGLPELDIPAPAVISYEAWLSGDR